MKITILNEPEEQKKKTVRVVHLELNDDGQFKMAHDDYAENSPRGGCKCSKGKAVVGSICIRLEVEE